MYAECDEVPCVFCKERMMEGDGRHPEQDAGYLERGLSASWRESARKHLRCSCWGEWI